MKFSTILAVIFGWFILSLAGHTMWKVMWFLSSFPSATQPYLNSDRPDENILMSLWLDACLILLFIIQHSWLKTKDIEKSLVPYGLNPCAARSLYVLLTSFTLQVLVKFWIPISAYNLWQFDVDGLIPWLSFTATHLLAWAFIYGGSVLLDLPELIGVKQIYYYHLEICETSDLKSTDLKRLYSHKRHPSFLGFIAILWITPIMSLDRILLAISITLYTATAWEPTLDDKRYHQQQLSQKRHQMEYTLRRKTEVQRQQESRHYRG